jgi:microcystin-dependent protein
MSQPLAYIPTGATMGWVAAVAPPGWLLCQGQAVLQSDYPELFAVLSTTWNTGGELGTEFRLPDGRGRALIGSGIGAGLTDRTLSQYIGEENTYISIAQMPSHSHGGSTYAQNLSRNFGAGSGAYAAGVHGTDTSRAEGSHSHGIPAEGGGAAHNNMAPCFVGNWIIKT